MKIAMDEATLSPNSSIPIGLATTGKKRRAAGILHVTPDGLGLFVRRSDKGDHPGEWALPGGGLERGEKAADAARRETSEETGQIPGDLKPLHRATSDDGVDFATFVAEVPRPFEPLLNEEHDDHAWLPLSEPPEPLHPGLKAALVRFFEEEAREGEHESGSAETIAREFAEDAGPEAEHVVVIHANGDFPWGKFLRHLHRLGGVGASRPVKAVDEDDQEVPFGWDGDGADKIVSAEIDGRDALSDPRATDHALMLAFDRESVRTVDRDGRLRVARTNICKANVCPYRGKEIPGWQDLGLDPDKIYQLLRDPEEIRKGAPTFNGLPVLLKHVPVSADDHASEITVGSTGTEAKYDDPYLTNGLVVWTRDAIDLIESGKQKEISPGYHYRPDMTPGVFNGIRYDGVMRDIVGNHIALVETGRQGQDVIVADSMETFMTTKPTRLAAFALLNTAKAVSPLLAMDQQVDLYPLFKDVNRANFAKKKATIIEGLKAALKGKTIAKDASMEHVVDMLDRLEGSAKKDETLDESVSEKQHDAMAAAAKGESNLGIPEKVGKEFIDADKGKTFDNDAVAALLREKGLTDEDIATVMALLEGGAEDEDAEEAKEDAEEEAARLARRKPNGEDRARGKDRAMMGKDELERTIQVAVDAATKKERNIRIALDEVRPYVGNLPNTIAFDSAAEVRRHALKMLGVDGVDQIKDDHALSVILSMQPKAGARPNNGRPTMAADAGSSEASKGFLERFPGAKNISPA